MSITLWLLSLKLRLVLVFEDKLEEEEEEEKKGGESVEEEEEEEEEVENTPGCKTFPLPPLYATADDAEIGRDRMPLLSRSKPVLPP
jgi:hypothetical protein